MELETKLRVVKAAVPIAVKWAEMNQAWDRDSMEAYLAEASKVVLKTLENSAVWPQPRQASSEEIRY